MELADRFRFFIYLFEQRPDVDITMFEVIEEEGFEGSDFDEEVPEDLLDFYRVFDGLEFSYDIAEGLDDHNGSGSGGRVTFERLMTGRSKWWGPAGWEPIDFHENFVVENINDEWMAQYVRQEDEAKTDARIAFFSSGDDYVNWWDDFEAYLTDGARHAFVWMWQQADVYWEVEVLLDVLLSNSIAPSTPREQIRDRLMEIGEDIGFEFLPLDVTDEVADDLIGWLGDRVVLLVPQS